MVGTGGVHGANANGPVGPKQGVSVAISGDGSTIAVGGSSDNSDAGAVWIFAQPRLSFTTPATVAPGALFNFSVSALDANNLLIPPQGGGTDHWCAPQRASR